MSRQPFRFSPLKLVVLDCTFSNTGWLTLVRLGQNPLLLRNSTNLVPTLAYKNGLHESFFCASTIQLKAVTVYLKHRLARYF